MELLASKRRSLSGWREEIGRFLSTAADGLQQVFVGEEVDSRSRDALILVAHVRHGYRLAEIARFLAVAPSTVSKAASRAQARSRPRV